MEVHAHVQGNTSGQNAVGAGNVQLQIDASHGGKVDLTLPGQHPRPRPLPTPIDLRPPPAGRVLDRVEAVGLLGAALRERRPADLHGEEGIGKTTLLCHLAHDTVADAFPVGVVYERVCRHQTAEDLLQFLFETFYECDPPYKPSRPQLRRYLRGKRALVLLDDVQLTREDAQELLNAARDCTFLLASPERRLWGGECAVALEGLPGADALELVAAELGRPLAPEERPAADALCAALKGHPLRIRLAVDLGKRSGRTLAEVARSLAPADPVKALTEQVAASRSHPERLVLAVLAALGGGSVHAAHLPALAGPAAGPALESLLGSGLVWADGPRCGLADALARPLQQAWDLAAWRERAFAYFTDWARANAPSPHLLLGEADVLFRTLEGVAEAGRWAEAWELSRALEGALVLGRRWGAWAKVLEWQARAARALNDPAARAWVLHQSGTRALCLGDTGPARRRLTEALRLRRSLGDREGAAVTRHNLEHLRGRPRWSGVLWVAVMLATALLTLGALARGFEPEPLEPLHLAAEEVASGARLRGEVRLRRPAPEGGAVVRVESDNEKAVVEEGLVFVPPGQRAAPFAVATRSVKGPTRVRITASYRTGRSSTVLTVGRLSVRLDAGKVQGGQVVRGTVELAGPAPEGGALVTFRGEGPLRTDKITVWIPAGKNEGRFAIPTSPVKRDARATVTARYVDDDQTAEVTVCFCPPKR